MASVMKSVYSKKIKVQSMQQMILKIHLLQVEEATWSQNDQLKDEYDCGLFLYRIIK